MKTWVLQSCLGAVGGGLSWAIAKAYGLPPLPAAESLNGLLVVLFCLVFGAVSAHVGAFLANPDPSNRHKLAVFALLCGLAWRPVIDAGKQYAAVAAGTKEVNQNREQLSRTIGSARVGTNQEGKTAANLATEIGAQAERVVTVTSVAPATPEAKKESDKTVSKAVETLTNQAVMHDASLESVNALYRVGEASRQAQNDGIAGLSAKKLDYLAANAANPEVKERAHTLALRLSAPMTNKQSSDPGKAGRQ